jgi:hypothetical protein
MTTNINADTSTGGAIITGDASGVLALQAAGTTQVTINTSGVTLANPLPVASGGTGGSATPTAGGVVYGTGTAQAVTSAGTAGYLLQSNGASAPTWVAAPSSAMTLISTATASSSSSINFTGLTSAYKNYVVIVTNCVPATNNAALYFRTSTNNGSSYDAGASDYYSSGTNFSNTTWNYLAAVDAQGYINSSGQENVAANGGTSFTLTLVNPSAANRIQWYATGFEYGTSEVGAFTRGGFRLATTGAVNAIRFLYNSGNIASGTFKLYGIS